MDLLETLSGDTQAPGTDRGAQSRGIDIKRADDGSIMLTAALTDVDGAAIASGTTTVRLLTENYETGELWAVDWADGSIHSSFDDVTTNTVEATHQSLGGTFDTGLWVYQVESPETYFDEGFKYIVCFQNSTAVPVVQWRLWQYGGTEGEAQWAEQMLSFVRSLARSDVDPDGMIGGDYAPAADSLEALQALGDTLSPEGEYDTVMELIDVAISTRSAHTATEVASEVWSAVERTLTEDVGADIDVDEIAAAVWSDLERTITGGTVGDIGGQDLSNLDMPISDLPTAADLADAVNGTGTNAVTLTLRDGAANGVTGIRCVVYDPEEAQVLCRGVTDASGEVAFALDDGTYPVYFGPSAVYTFTNPYSVTVDGVTAAEYTCEALTIPAADDPARCAVYAHIRDAQGNLVGAGDGRIDVVGVPGTSPAVIDEQFAGYDEDADYATTDASGLVEIELLRDVQYRLKITALDAEQTKTLTIPDQASYQLPVGW